MHPMLNIAVKAARRAGNIINRASRNLDIVAVREKAANDFVSEVDREAEQAIIRALHDAYPDHSILAEESGASGESEYQWIIDPLDGTTNFIHGFPQYAVAIALRHRGVVTQGVIYDPSRNDLFTATRGRGRARRSLPRQATPPGGPGSAAARPAGAARGPSFSARAPQRRCCRGARSRTARRVYS